MGRIKQIEYITLGGDPELFIEDKSGHIVGSDAAIPPEGLARGSDPKISSTFDSGKITRDGVQVEINMQPTSCRGNLGNYTAVAFKKLKNQLDSRGLKLSKNPVIEFTKEELAKLSDDAKKLGCAPSHSVYGRRTIKVDGAKYPKRSAGGHIHLGYCKSYIKDHHFPDPERDVVPLLDFMVSNVCVLIDRDPKQKERRKVYGRAGEYRLPSHGLEYRTQSNWWIRAYPLMSFVMQMARLAYTISYPKEFYKKENILSYYGSYNPESTLKSILPKLEAREFIESKWDKKLMVAAINENDPEKAMYNYLVFKEFVSQFVPDLHPSDYTSSDSDKTFPIWPSALPWFDYFIEKGLDHWFENDPFKNWINMPDGHGRGWEAFLGQTVGEEYKKTLQNEAGKSVLA